MNKLRGKILNKSLLMLVIAGITMFNFSFCTTIVVCKDAETEETCCYSSDCSAEEQHAPDTEIISSYCECTIIELTSDNASGKALINPSNNSGNSTNINFAKLAACGFDETQSIKSSNNFVKPPGNILYAVEDIYLINSIFRI